MMENYTDLKEMTTNKTINKILLFFCGISLLLTCSCGYGGYNSLSEEEKEIVDTVYANRTSWEQTVLEYGVVTVRGETVMRDVSFIGYNGSLALVVDLSLDANGKEIVRKYYTCDDSMELLETNYTQIMGSSGWEKSYYTTWSPQEKIDYISEEIYKYNHK